MLSTCCKSNITHIDCFLFRLRLPAEVASRRLQTMPKTAAFRAFPARLNRIPADDPGIPQSEGTGLCRFAAAFSRTPQRRSRGQLQPARHLHRHFRRMDGAENRCAGGPSLPVRRDLRGKDLPQRLPSPGTLSRHRSRGKIHRSSAGRRQCRRADAGTEEESVRPIIKYRSKDWELSICLNAGPGIDPAVKHRVYPSAGRRKRKKHRKDCARR